MVQAPRLSRAVLVLVLAGYAVLEVEAFLGGPTPAVRLGGVAAVLGLLALQLTFLRPTGSVPGRLLLPVQAALVHLPLLLVGTTGPAAPGFLVGSLLLVLPVTVGAPLGVAVVVAAAVLDPIVGVTDGSPVRSALVALITGLVVCGLTTLVRLVEQGHHTCHEVRRSAAERERLRMGEDVHDLLGLGLSAITLKCELTWRLLGCHPGRPEQARAQLAEVLTMARRALGDVRTVASGRFELSLDEECRLARATLTTVGVQVRLLRSGPGPTGQVGTALAFVLREGITNVLRHSDARWCEITLVLDGTTASLGIVNDGIHAPEPDPGGGHGLHNLSQRVQRLGGTLVEGSDDRIHRLRVCLPVEP